MRVVSFIRGPCGGPVRTEMLQSQYEPESGVTEIRVPGIAHAAAQAGDANGDGSFNQLDLIQVLVAGEYLPGEPATWGEGDWDGWNKPYQEGDRLFNQRDIIAALHLPNDKDRLPGLTPTGSMSKARPSTVNSMLMFWAPSHVKGVVRMYCFHASAVCSAAA